MKICRILSSRFKKPSEEEFTHNRRKVCSSCEHNSKNVEKIPFLKRILKYLSDFYSYITFNSEEDKLGNCIACDSCSIFYKTETKIEKCPKEKWKD